MTHRNLIKLISIPNQAISHVVDAVTIIVPVIILK